MRASVAVAAVLAAIVGSATPAASGAATTASGPGAAGGSGNLKFDYSVISSTGMSCPGRDSCRQTRNTRGPATTDLDWKRRNCFCDNDCAVYGDCCVDAPAYRQDEQMVRTWGGGTMFPLQHSQLTHPNMRSYSPLIRLRFNAS